MHRTNLEDLFHSDKRWKIANLRYFNPVGSVPLVY